MRAYIMVYTTRSKNIETPPRIEQYTKRLISRHTFRSSASGGSRPIDFIRAFLCVFGCVIIPADVQGGMHPLRDALLYLAAPSPLPPREGESTVWRAAAGRRRGSLSLGRSHIQCLISCKARRAGSLLLGGSFESCASCEQ